MICLETPSLDRFAAALLQPATVAERGAHAPFTTPSLFAARLRRAPARGLEVVMPNLSGRPGFLVLPWPAVLDACRPSLADRALAARLEDEAPTPPTLRRAALEVALGGLAGRRAQQAAGRSLPGMPPGAGLGPFAQALLDWTPQAPSEAEGHVAAALAGQLAAVLRAAGQAEAERAAWLLDGWGLLAAQWRVAEAEQRPALIRACATLAPHPSEDMRRWPGCAGLSGPASRTGVPPRFASQAQCEAALAAWLEPA
jgi:hypothetical protein